MSLALLACGAVVHDRYNSHNHVGMSSLKKAFQKVKAPAEGKLFATTVELDFHVGSSICVSTSDNDQIVFAQRPRHEGKTRFVLNRVPQSTNKVSFVLSRITKNEWLIKTAYYGSLHPPEPFDPEKTEESISFWSTHALIWGYTEVIAGTVTRKCPW